jgi:ferredoxin like protein
MSVKTERPLKLEDILNSNIWDVDYEPHIKVNAEKCENCDQKSCVKLCPAGCYTLLEGKILFSYEGCLECGTCRVICPEEAIEWNYPVSGRGIYFRFG